MHRPHQSHGRCGGFDNDSFARVPGIRAKPRRFLDQEANQACCRDLSGERFLRPLFRYLSPRQGNGSADAIAGTLNGMFDFDDAGHNHKLFLDPVTGQILNSDAK